MSLDDKLAASFGKWSAARDKLAMLRRELAGHMPAGKQLAATPEAIAHLKSVAEQEAVCERVFADMIRVAEERALVRDAQQDTGPDARADGQRPPAGPAADATGTAGPTQRSAGPVQDAAPGSDLEAS